jgi:AraC family transcriptional activator of pobA
MLFEHIVPKTNGRLVFLHQEPIPGRLFKERAAKEQLLTLAMNSGGTQQIVINGSNYEFPSESFVPLVSNEMFTFEKPEQITAWQYNRDFYCLLDAHYEISCIGLLFFGFSGNIFLKLSDTNRNKLETLKQMFKEEFLNRDIIQSDMLQILLKQLIILITRLAKEQYISEQIYSDQKFDIIRQYNVLVDKHYKKEHSVQFYAGLLNKAPKTLSNLFAQYNYRSPSLIIHDRITSEAKRLLYYSNKSAKEIAYEIGFEDAAHFSRFFKNTTGQSTSDFRKPNDPA